MAVISADDHIQVLEKELDKLRSELAKMNLRRKEIKESNRALNRHFKLVSKNHTKLNRSYEKHKKEMWFSVIAGNTVVATRAEEKLRRVIEEQARLQREMPDQYKTWAEAVRLNVEAREQRIEWQLKIALKEEEIHRLKPCVSVTCKHCKRFDTTALKMAKVVFKDGVTRFLKATAK